jgi:hypothetical protein
VVPLPAIIHNRRGDLLVRRGYDNVGSTIEAVASSTRGGFGDRANQLDGSTGENCDAGGWVATIRRRVVAAGNDVVNRQENLSRTMDENEENGAALSRCAH